MGKLHYVDEGDGQPIVMVHGTPTWSFEFREVIKGLSANHRCVAIDHIGFGLSDKPKDWPYLPFDHAQNVERLIESLNLKDITLIVHDFGGPIGLSYAISHPENVRQLVIMNTWMWSLKNDPHFSRAGNLLGGPIGKILYERFNFSPRVMMRLTFGDRSKLTKHVHRHYLNALRTAKDRHATWVFARELIGSSEWYDSLWSQRDKIKTKPTLILWGMKDSAFRETELARWESLFSNAETHRFENVGHFVVEEIGDQLAPVIDQFLDQLH